MKQALDLSPVATVIVDLKTHPHPVMYVNQAFEALSGYDAAELIGQSWDKLVDGAPAAAGSEPCTARLNCHPRLGATEHLQFDLLPLYDRPGQPRFWLATEHKVLATELQEDDGEREALLTVLRDARMHLRRLDGRDTATGVLNRRAFEDLLQRDWVMARREQRSLAALVFEMDGYEGYRDVFGRHAADACLRKVAHAITGSMRRAGDLTARIAEDRFVVLMGEADRAQAEDLAQQIASRVRGLAIHHPRSLRDRFVTVSFGVASMVPGSGNSGLELLEAAEAGVGKAAPGDRQQSAG